MITHQGEHFHNRTITLDGQGLVDCDFINPDLRYSAGPPFELSENRFPGSANIQFDRRGKHTKTLVAVLDHAFREAGWDLQLIERFSRPGGGVAFPHPDSELSAR